MLKNTLIDVFYGMWPMLLIFTVILTSVRIAYLIGTHQKIVLYKEILMLAFAIYILMLFYVVTFQDSGAGTSNYTPFRELFRYHVGSHLFFKNIIGNLLLFVPFGLFVSYYINNHRILPVFILSIISSVAIEITQSKIGRVFDIDDIILNVVGGIVGYLLFIFLDTISKHIPRLFKKDWMKNLIILIILLLILLYFLNFDTALFKFMT